MSMKDLFSSEKRANEIQEMESFLREKLGDLRPKLTFQASLKDRLISSETFQQKKNGWEKPGLSVWELLWRVPRFMAWVISSIKTFQPELFKVLLSTHHCAKKHDKILICHQE